MNQSVTLALRFPLVLLFLGALLMQTVIIPVAAGQEAEYWPEVAFLAVPYSVIAILVVMCAEIVLIAVWVLLSMVERGAIFTERAFLWVDVIIGSAATATVLCIAVAGHLLVVLRAGGPGVVLALGGASVAGVTFILLMVVMRGLLRAATRLESELAEVV